MTYQEKGDYLFTKYQQAFILNVLFVILFISFEFGVKINLIVATAFIVSAIIIYFIHKTVGFLSYLLP